MSYQDCVCLTMQVLQRLLEKGWTVKGRDNFNEIHLQLTDQGFVYEEEQKFHGDYTYGYSRFNVSPIFIISMLFDGDGENKKDTVTVVGSSISNSQFDKAISFLPIVEMVDAMRDEQSRGIVGDAATDIQYTQFKKMMAGFQKDDYASLKNQVLAIRNLDYDTLTNLRNSRRGLARRLERMYQVEKKLVDYCKRFILEEKGFYEPDIFDDLDLHSDYEKLLKQVDLSKEHISWEDFCYMIRTYLELSFSEENNKWRREKGYYNPKITVLGLDEMLLPASPLAYQKHYG